MTRNELISAIILQIEKVEKKLDGSLSVQIDAQNRIALSNLYIALSNLINI